MESGYLVLYPRTDIERRGDRWVVVEDHPGVARDWTDICQDYPELKSPRLDFDINNPGHWYFINLKEADAGAFSEIAKYVAKGSELAAKGELVIEYLFAIKGRRLLDTFGAWRGKLDVDGKTGRVEEIVDAPEDDGPAPRRGECPWPTCPEPQVHDWGFVGYGPPDSSRVEDLVWERETRSFMVLTSARGQPPPSPEIAGGG